MSEPVVCSIGSTDPWNAAGLGLDVRALAECGAWPVTVVAGVTAQDRHGLHALHPVPAAIVGAQLQALRDAPVAAFRIGALLDAATVELVAAHLAAARVPVVYDPVLAASGGGAFAFADDATLRAIVERLLPCASVVTPNLAEAARLTGTATVADIAAMERAARALRDLGAEAALVKGGHLRDAATDVLVDRDGACTFEGPQAAGSLRGTGCLLACALASRLAHGDSLRPAIAFARAFVYEKFASARATGGMSVAY